MGQQFWIYVHPDILRWGWGNYVKVVISPQDLGIPTLEHSFHITLHYGGRVTRRSRRRILKKCNRILRAASTQATRLHGQSKLPAVLEHYGWGTNFTLSGEFSRLATCLRGIFCSELQLDPASLPDLHVTWKRPPEF